MPTNAPQINHLQILHRHPLRSSRLQGIAKHPHTPITGAPSALLTRTPDKLVAASREARGTVNVDYSLTDFHTRGAMECAFATEDDWMSRLP